MAKNVQEGHYMYPFLIGTLIVLRLQEPSLYREFFKGKRHGGDVMNYIDKKMPDVELYGPINNTLHAIELCLYATKNETMNQLELLRNNQQLTHPEYLSEKTRSDEKRKSNLLSYYEKMYPPLHRIDILYIHRLIELTNIE